ncbi:G1 family glutamic endopeptidase [Streptomyces sp. NPDC001480]|uniref:G1 family glutamic endopeptidase n=1 Tax=Streptomyces sp. NPDC001480 TaxID=3364577 RepID=UPI0036CC29FD
MRPSSSAPQNNDYAVKLTDSTQNWTATKTLAHYKGATNGSAEVIAEAPTQGNGSRWPLANFGSVTFTGASIDGKTLYGIGAKPVTMVQSGTTDAVVSALSSSGDSFTSTWKHY